MSFESTFWHSVITAVKVIDPWQSINTILITEDVEEPVMGFFGETEPLNSWQHISKFLTAAPPLYSKYLFGSSGVSWLLQT